MPLFHLDMVTILFVLAVLNLAAVVFVCVHGQLTKTDLHFWYFILAKTFQGLSWTFRAMSFTGPVGWAGPVADLTLLVGFTLESVLMVRFTQKLAPRHLAFFSGVFVVLVTGALCFGANDELVRDLVVFLGFLGLMAYAAIRLYFTPGAGRFQRFLAVVYAVFPVLQAVLYGLVTSEVSHPGLSRSLKAEIYYGLLIILQLVGSVGYLLMVKERDTAVLLDQATHDPLTGALNRRAFFQRASYLVANACRKAEPVSVILADLDHFKLINDHHSHQVGDQVLGVFARAVEKSIRGGDIFARNGGDEFVVYLPDTDEQTAALVSERIRTNLGTLGASREIPVFTVSLGIGTGYPKEPGDLHPLIATADQALYMAKQNGRNRVEALVWGGPPVKRTGSA